MTMEWNLLGGRILAADMGKMRWAEKHKGRFVMDIGGSAAGSAIEADGEEGYQIEGMRPEPFKDPERGSCARGGGVGGRHGEPLDRGRVKSC